MRIHRINRWGWTDFWAEQTSCGEMWVGWYADGGSPDGFAQAGAFGDHDTALFHARRQWEQQRCRGFLSCQES